MSRVAIRYSKALFDSAYQKDKLDIVLNDLREVESLAGQDNLFAQLLQNPLIQANRKLQIITDLFKGKVDDLTFNFLSLVTQKKRSDFLVEIIKRFAARIDEHNGIIKGELISATKIDPEQIKGIISKIEALTEKKIRLEFKIDAKTNRRICS